MLTNIQNLPLSLTLKQAIVFAIGIIAGAVFFIKYNEIFFPPMSLYHELNTDTLSASTTMINHTGLFSHITKKRLKEFAILTLTQLTPLRYVLSYSYCIIFGFMFSILQGFYIQQYGISGLLFFICTIIPHFLFYALAWNKMCTNDILHSPSFKLISSIVLFILAGIVCESLLNVFLMKIIIKSF